MQTTFDTFMGQVEVATVKAEAAIKEVAGDGGVYLFQAKPDMFGEIEVAKELTKIWTRIYHHGSIDKFFDVTLAVLEHREDDYMKLIEGLNADVLKGYTALGHYYPTNCPIIPQPASASSTTCHRRML